MIASQDAQKIIYVLVVLLLAALGFMGVQHSTPADKLSATDVLRKLELKRELATLRGRVATLRAEKHARKSRSAAMAAPAHVASPASVAPKGLAPSVVATGQKESKVGLFILCINSTDYAGKPGTWQLTRAKNVACTLDKVKSKMKRYALTSGCGCLLHQPCIIACYESCASLCELYAEAGRVAGIPRRPRTNCALLATSLSTLMTMSKI